MEIVKQKSFGNGMVYALLTQSGKIIETTDTYLPDYTVDAINQNCNNLITEDFGDRKQRWMIGVSTMSGCPVGCRFCATGSRYNGPLSAQEIMDQVDFIVDRNPDFNPGHCSEFKVLMTRMGEPALNHVQVSKAIVMIKERYPDAQISISTIGIKNSALEDWLKLSRRYDGLQLQFSIHTTSEIQRDELIPLKKMGFDDIGRFGKRWMEGKDRKISLNFTLVNENEFDVDKLSVLFDKENFFVKLSPLNENRLTEKNGLKGTIKKINIA